MYSIKLIKLLTLITCFVILFPAKSESNDFLRREIRTHIYNSILVNFHEFRKDKYINNNYSHLNFLNYSLDPNCYYVFDIEKLNKSINYYDLDLELYSYEFNFNSECPIESVNDLSFYDSLMIRMSGTPSGVNRFQMPYHVDFPKLHKKGLFGITIDTSAIVFISGTSFNEVIENYMIDTLSVENVNKVILLKYYNFNPKDIEIDIRNSIFSFYSGRLERFIKGKILTKSFGYELKLEEGIMVGI